MSYGSVHSETRQLYPNGPFLTCTRPITEVNPPSAGAKKWPVEAAFARELAAGFAAALPAEVNAQAVRLPRNGTPDRNGLAHSRSLCTARHARRAARPLCSFRFFSWYQGRKSRPYAQHQRKRPQSEAISLLTRGVLSRLAIRLDCF